MSLSLSLSPAAPAQLAQQPEDLPEGMYRCEFCGHVEHKAKFLAPSRRFCSLTCCKRLGDLSLSSLFFLSVSCPFASPSFPPSLYFPCPLLIAYWRAEQTSWPIYLNYIQLPCSMGLLTFAIAVVNVCYSTLYRYSAEKRYYPYGKDEEGIAQSIREGLLNPNRSSSKPGRGSKQVSHMISNP